MVDTGRIGGREVRWRFVRGHIFASLAGVCSVTAIYVSWGDLNAVTINPAPMKIVTTIILVIWATSISAVFTAPYSYLIFRLLKRFRALNLATCILGGICCAGLPVLTSVAGALVIGGMEPNSSEDMSPFAGVGDGVMDIELAIALAFSGAVGGIGFYCGGSPSKRR